MGTSSRTELGAVTAAERAPAPTIPIVDDEDSRRNLCRDVINDSGLRTRTASTTEQALEILDQWSVEILITDLRVPQMGGLELLKRVRRDFPQTAVLVLTQYGTIESAVEATRLGAADYITKPFHIPELRTKIDRMIRMLDVDQENRVLRETLRDAPLLEFLRQLNESAPVVLIASLDRQNEVAKIVAGGKVEFVGRQGDYTSLAAQLALRHLATAGRSESAASSLGAAMSDEIAEIFRHDINNPLTGILGHAELVLSHGAKLAPADIQRLQTVVELAVRLRETIRRLSDAWGVESRGSKSA